MGAYKFIDNKKIVKNPLRVLNMMVISCSQEKSLLYEFIEVDNLEDILIKLKDNEIKYLELIEVAQQDFEAIIDCTCSYIECLKFFNCSLSLSSLSKCMKLKEVDIFLNQKLTELWNVDANKEIYKLSINDCENLKDISGICNSTLCELEIKKGFSTIPDVLNIQIKDFNVFSSLKQLKKLTLFVLENQDKSKDLEALSKLTQLESLYLPREYFTFEEFAWLKSRLKDTKKIDCIYYLAKDPANEKVVAIIIGKDQPYWIYDDGSDYKLYHEKYAELIKKYLKD